MAFPDIHETGWTTRKHDLDVQQIQTVDPEQSPPWVIAPMAVKEAPQEAQTHQDKLSPAKRPGETTEQYVSSLTIRRWETTNRFPKQITAKQFVRITSMEAKGSGRCDTSWLSKALDTIPFDFHRSKMRKWKLDENLPQMNALKIIISSSPSSTALSCSPSFCWQDG